MIDVRLIDADSLVNTIKGICALTDIMNGHREKSDIQNAERRVINAVVRMIENIPTIEPEPKWIPCSETVDIPDHEILACDKYGEEMFGYLAYEDDQWICASDGYEMVDPIAWREKPEPYREEGAQE